MTFILIDDDPISNLIHRKIIESTCQDKIEVISFLTVEKGLEFVAQCHNRNFYEYVVLLDINMPGLSGWDFLNELGRLGKAWINVYMLTSSVAKSDRAKAKSYKAVKGYLCKPLSIPALKGVLQEQVAHDS